MGKRAPRRGEPDEHEAWKAYAAGARGAAVEEHHKKQRAELLATLARIKDSPAGAPANEKKMATGSG